MKSPIGPLYYHASKIIEYHEDENKIVKDKKRDIEHNTGVIMHFTEQEVQYLNNQLRELSRLQASVLVNKTIGGKQDE